MSDRTTVPIETPVLEHPAMRALRRLWSRCGEPMEIETLKQKSRTAVYRLTGVGPGESAIIAKRCLPDTAWVERTVYEEILPCLPIRSLQYYGFVDDEREQVCWLFLEDAGKARYSALTPEHRALAAQWFAFAHTCAAPIVAGIRLPDRGPSHYLAHLQFARNTLRSSLSIPSLSGDELATLQAIIAQCDLLELRWNRLAACCDAIPSTLVHGDFQPKNARVRSGPEGMVIFLLDWEHAGRGGPAPDLADLDLTAYWPVARESWRGVDIGAIKRLAIVGKIFRWLAAVSWEGASLLPRYEERPIRRMRYYHDQLAAAIKELQ